MIIRGSTPLEYPIFFRASTALCIKRPRSELCAILRAEQEEDAWGTVLEFKRPAKPPAESDIDKAWSLVDFDPIFVESGTEPPISGPDVLDEAARAVRCFKSRAPTCAVFSLSFASPAVTIAVEAVFVIAEDLHGSCVIRTVAGTPRTIVIARVGL